MAELKKYKNLKLSYDVAIVTNGSQTVNIENGLTKKEFTTERVEMVKR
jgi:hypothetical protein